MSAVVLEVDGLSVSYRIGDRDFEAVDRVSATLHAGEILGIVGESGCGKSTLAAALLHLLPANGSMSGHVRLQGRELAALRDSEMRDVRGRDLVAVFQDPFNSLNPTLTVGRQMADAALAHDRQRSSRRLWRNRAVAALERVGIPDAPLRLAQYPHELSGGMRQRVMIAIALLLKPAVLIMDEPTSSLDVTIEAQILHLVQDLRRTDGTAVLFISHDLGVIAQLCDKVAVMYAGHIVEEAPARQLFANPSHPYTRALLASIPSYRRRFDARLATIPGAVPGLEDRPPGCRFVDRCSFARDVCQRAVPPLVSVGTGHVRCVMFDPTSGYDAAADLRSMAPAEEPRRSGPHLVPVTRGSDSIVAMQNVSTHFATGGFIDNVLRREVPPVRAVDGVTLNIRRGESLGLVGESGSGKTTLGRTALRLVEATNGRLQFDGIELRRLGRRELRRLRRRAQMVFQDPYGSLSPRFRVRDILMEPYEIHNPEKSERYSVGELLEMVGLRLELAAKFPHQLSGGQARRVGIARALALHPELLVADEPTSGLDVSAAAGILNLMKDLGTRLGLTYLLITHNLNVVGYLADRVAVMYLGRIVEIGPTAAIFEAPAHPYTQALLQAVAEPDPNARRSHRVLLPGEIPSPRNPPSGCRFHTRCPYVQQVCRSESPPLEVVGDRHEAACLFSREIRAGQLLPSFASAAPQADVPRPILAAPASGAGSPNDP